MFEITDKFYGKKVKLKPKSIRKSRLYLLSDVKKMLKYDTFVI